jgi:hypothetical protein
MMGNRRCSLLPSVTLLLLTPSILRVAALACQGMRDYKGGGVGGICSRLHLSVLSLGCTRGFGPISDRGQPLVPKTISVALSLEHSNPA